MYKASELYLIQDKSPEHNETWKFLNRRLSEAIQLHDVLLKSDLASQGAKDTVAAAFITVNYFYGDKGICLLFSLVLGEEYLRAQLEQIVFELEKFDGQGTIRFFLVKIIVTLSIFKFITYLLFVNKELLSRMSFIVSHNNQIIHHLETLTE